MGRASPQGRNARGPWLPPFVNSRTSRCARPRALRLLIWLLRDVTGCKICRILSEKICNRKYSLCVRGEMKSWCRATRERGQRRGPACEVPATRSPCSRPDGHPGTGERRSTRSPHTISATRAADEREERRRDDGTTIPCLIVPTSHHLEDGPGKAFLDERSRGVLPSTRGNVLGVVPDEHTPPSLPGDRRRCRRGAAPRSDRRLL